jgi:hypothetical protein
MGIPTEGIHKASERQLLEYAASADLEGQGDCVFRKDEAKATKLPCELMPLSNLATHASLGHRHSLLELGVRFENGRGVRRDFDKAEELYLAAGRENSGTIHIWVPGVGDAPGSVQRFNKPFDPGLPEAFERLRALRAKRAALAGQPV